MAKKRLDLLVTEKGHAESREKAQRLIRAGKVFVENERATKPGHLYAEDVCIAVTEPPRFVGRGGEKMEGAFKAFDIHVNGLTCGDIGASTGGFTDCMLQHGAARVYAIDVGRGQLHWKLRQDSRVMVMEGVNCRYLSPDMFSTPIQFASIDVSFISLTKILPAVTQCLAGGSHIMALIKPQFEAGKKEVERGGVVRSEEVRKGVIQKIQTFATTELQLECCGIATSPLQGPAGNTEFLSLWRKP